MIITIDGPAGTGKSTVAKGVAQKLGFSYFNTGATYRSLTWYLLERGIDHNDESSTKKALEEFASHFRYENERYLIDGQDITETLHSQRITAAVSQVAKHAYVREKMVPIQRAFATHCKNTVFEGRDIGTVVFPLAECKIFLTASAEVRAKRRLKDFAASGDKVSYEEVLRAIEERDHSDRTRAVGPLKQADDAVLIDTSDLAIDEVIAKIVEIAGR